MHEKDADIGGGQLNQVVWFNRLNGLAHRIRTTPAIITHSTAHASSKGQPQGMKIPQPMNTAVTTTWNQRNQSRCFRFCGGVLALAHEDLSHEDRNDRTYNKHPPKSPLPSRITNGLKRQRNEVEAHGCEDRKNHNLCPDLQGDGP